MAWGSTAIAKKEGERGQPCYTEQCKGNLDDLSLFVKIEHTDLAYIHLTHDINVSPNPNFCNDSTSKATQPDQKLSVHPRIELLSC